MASDCAPAARVTKAAAATMSERTLVDVFIVQVLGTQECFEDVRPPGRSGTTPKTYRVESPWRLRTGYSDNKLAFSAARLLYVTRVTDREAGQVRRTARREAGQRRCAAGNPNPAFGLRNGGGLHPPSHFPPAQQRPPPTQTPIPNSPPTPAPVPPPDGVSGRAARVHDEIGEDRVEFRVARQVERRIRRRDRRLSVHDGVGHGQHARRDLLRARARVRHTRAVSEGDGPRVHDDG